MAANYVTKTPRKQLTSGAKGQFPLLGFGTFGGSDSGVELANAVGVAIDAGYRHFDLAEAYHNHKVLGDAFRKAFESGKVRRDELFITTKLWNTFHKKEQVAAAIDRCLKDLQLEYVDLFLVHWPFAFKTVANELSDSSKLMELDSEGNVILEPSVTTEETWRAMEEVYKSKKARHIGVCNYSIPLLKKLLGYAEIKPAVVQVELHPLFPQVDLCDFCEKNGIVVTAYSPLGRPDKKHDHRVLLQDPVIGRLAEKHGVEPANIVLKWAMDRGIAVIPKSKTPSRIVSNLQKSLDLKLSSDEIKEISGVSNGSPISYISFHATFSKIPKFKELTGY